jgi:hypothetical protein
MGALGEDYLAEGAPASRRRSRRPEHRTHTHSHQNVHHTTQFAPRHWPAQCGVGQPQAALASRAHEGRLTTAGQDACRVGLALVGRFACEAEPPWQATCQCNQASMPDSARDTFSNFNFFSISRNCLNSVETFKIHIYLNTCPKIMKLVPLFF